MTTGIGVAMGGALALGLGIALAVWLNSAPTPTQAPPAQGPEPQAVHAPTRRAPPATRTSAPPAAPPTGQARGATPSAPSDAPQAPDAAPPTRDAAQELDARLDEIASWRLDDYRRVTEAEGWSPQKRREFEDRLMDPARWDKTCGLARDLLADDPGAAQTFSEVPEALPALPVWVLRWHGVPFPVPAVEFSALRAYRNTQNGRPNVFLLGPDVSMLVGVYPNEPLKMAYLKLPPEVSAQMTREVFGGPASMEELVVKGLDSTPGDLTCEPGRGAQEVVTALGLTHKQIGQAQAVYPSGAFPGWVWKRNSGQKLLWDARIFPLEIDEELTIAYTVMPGEPFEEVGVLVGRVEADAGPARPTWVDALGRALTEDTEEAWQALDAAVAGTSIHQYQRTFKRGAPGEAP